MDKFQKYLIERLNKNCGGLLIEFINNEYGISFWSVMFENNNSRYYIIFCDINNLNKMDDSVCRYGKFKDIKSEFLIKIIFTHEKLTDFKGCMEKNIILINKSDKEVMYSGSNTLKLGTLLQDFMNDMKNVSEKHKYWVTWSIISINVIMYLISSILSGNPFNMDINVLNMLGAKNNELIAAGQYYRFITCIFLHANIIHIASNMYSLYCVGYLVEKVYGRSKYIFIYLLSGIISSYVSFLFSSAISIGASGAIFGVLGAVLVFSIKFKDRIGKELFINIIAIIVLNIFIGMSMTNIDNFAHIGGLVSGIIISAIIGVKKENAK